MLLLNERFEILVIPRQLRSIFEGSDVMNFDKANYIAESRYINVESTRTSRCPDIVLFHPIIRVIDKQRIRLHAHLVVEIISGHLL